MRRQSCRRSKEEEEPVPCPTRLRITTPSSNALRSLSAALAIGFAAYAAAPPLVAQSTAHADSTITRRLMPVPASISFEPGRLPIDSGFTVVLRRYESGRLERGVRRAMLRLERRTGVDIQPISPDTALATLVIDVAGPGEKVQSVDEDESYSIDISSSRATLQANTVVGALRGLETLLQLVESDSSGFHFPLAHIDDSPRFPWRGLLIDVSRHFQTVEEIKRNLDAMSMVKLNVLHWHLSDDQGFRVESRLHPDLQRRGSDGLYYTQAQIRDVVAYARDRGIRVIPEFDMPGHSTSWMVGYPQFASAPGPYTIGRRMSGYEATFDPTRESVYNFIDSFVGEISKLFPDPYWHIGGDEVNPKQWNENARIRRFMKRHGFADNAALQAYFNRRLAAILKKHGKRVVGWDEIMHPKLPKTVVVQSWRGQESLSKGARDGFRGILSAGYYLDHMRSAAEIYRVDPIPPGSDLDSAQAARILGGEACMWAELITDENIDSRIWPRTAVVAERLWSPDSVRDVDDMYRRLAYTSLDLESAGLRHISGPETMLRRIAGPGNDAELESLLELMKLVAPLSLGQHVRVFRPLLTYPLVRPGDIARPDPAAARTLSARVDALLSDAPGAAAQADTLSREFAQWTDMARSLASLARRTPLVDGADSAAALIARLGAVGNEAISFLARGEAPSAEWKAGALQLLERADAPVGLLRVAVAPAIRKLVFAATDGTRTGGTRGARTR
jgi:hexosaminidase